MRRALAMLLMTAILVGLLPPPPLAAAPMPQASPCAAAVLAAVAQRGKPYVWGAKGPNSFDCSGLTRYAWLQAGQSIGVSTFEQALAGRAIPCRMSDLAGAASTCWQPGDLIFLRNGGSQHVAMYVGNGVFADAYNTSTGVIVHEVANDSYYHAHFWQARRIVSCDGVTIDPITADNPDLSGSASLEQLPDLLFSVTYRVPQCDDCNDDGTFVLPPTEWSESWPSGWGLLDVGEAFRVSISWLAWQVREIIRQLICWLFFMLQLLIDAASSMINVVIAGLNAIWKLFVFLWLTLRAWFYAFWEAMEWIRDLLWQILRAFEAIGPIALFLWDIFVFIGILIGELLGLLWTLAGIMIGLVGWIGGIALGFWIVVLGAFQGTTIPAELGGGNRVYWMVRGGLEAILDSRIAFLYWLAVASIYIGFIYWMARFLSIGAKEQS